MNDVAVIQKELPEPVSRRGINEPQWRTLVNNLYPGADVNSVLMVWDYCAARKLDPLKKPCHIVPMKVKVGRDWVWRDVVMAGIYEYRTTAARTGLYLGHSIPVYGPMMDFLGVMAPEWVDYTVYRWNPVANMRAEHPVQIRFSEVVATTYDKTTDKRYVNDRWTKAPQQMLTKCAEAAALREAFPDELGGTHTEEEMAGFNQDVPEPVQDIRSDPRGDLSGVDTKVRDDHVSSIADILNDDKDEFAIADALRDYVATHLTGFQEMEISVVDRLASDKIISKQKWKDYLKIGLDKQNA